MTTKFHENMQAHRKYVEQLRAEAAVQRLPVSECAEELIKYCERLQDNDIMVNGFAKQSDNPFREKSGCTILWELNVGLCHAYCA